MVIKLSDFAPERPGVLVIVPCGRSKIWHREHDAGETEAREACRGAPFKVNREYAESFVDKGDRWVILSSKYGFVSPCFLIPGPYEVTFKKMSTKPVAMETLRRQIYEQGLDQFRIVVGLGGKEYRKAIDNAFIGTSVDLYYPFPGLAIGKAMQATKKAVQK